MRGVFLTLGAPAPSPAHHPQVTRIGPCRRLHLRHGKSQSNASRETLPRYPFRGPRRTSLTITTKVVRCMTEMTRLLITTGFAKLPTVNGVVSLYST